MAVIRYYNIFEAETERTNLGVMCKVGDG